MNFNHEQFEAHVATLIEKHQIASNELDERQLAEAFKQALMAGDFQKLVAQKGQTILYMPFSGVDELRADNHRLKTLLQKHGINWTEEE